MARRLRRILSLTVSAALILVSAGLDAQRAAAQTLTGRAVQTAPTPVIGVGSVITPTVQLNGGALSPSALTLSAPSALIAAPTLVSPTAAAALKPVTPAAAIAEKIKAAAPALQVLAKPESGVSAASVAGRDLEAVLTGQKVTGSYGSEVLGSQSAIPSALAPTLSAPSAPDAKATPEAPKAPEAPKTVQSATSYRFHRWALKTIAALTGAVFSVPQAGPALTAKIIASAADKQLVISDFDDTLAPYNAVLPAEKVEAIRAIRKAGKHFAVVSDRGDVKRAGSTQLTVFESLASLPNDVTEGMYVAANSGGKLYQFQNGTPVKIWEAPALEADNRAKVEAASKATVARMKAELGLDQHPGDSLNPSESYNTYGYALMVKVGATAGQMKQVAEIMREELLKQGMDVEVTGRLPKDLANPGYATFSIITKTPAAGKIAEALGMTAKDVLTIGDMQYVPRKAKKESWLTRLGLKLSGLPLAEVGNETDRNMAKGVPGSLALGVGRKMDPRTPNGWNLAGHGPEVTQKVLESVASKPARPGSGVKKALKAIEDRYKTDLSKIPGVSKVVVEDTDYYYGGNLNSTDGKRIRVIFAGVAQLMAGRAALPAALPAIEGIKDVSRYNVEAEVEKGALRAAYRELEARHSAELAQIPGVSKVIVEDNDFYYGGNTNSTDGKRIRVIFADVRSLQAALAALPEVLPAIDGVKDVARYVVVPSVVEETGSGWKTAGGVLLVVALLAAIGGAGYAFITAIADIIAQGEQLLRQQPWDDMGMMLGAAGLGIAGMLGHSHRGHLTDPNSSYSAAYKRATEIAVEAGAKAEDVRFIEATASMPARDGAQWKYTFSMPKKDGGTSLIYVDFSNFFGGSTQDFQSRVYEGAAPSANAIAFPMAPATMAMGVKVSPESALTMLRTAHKEFGAGVSVSLGVEAEPVSNDQDAWYRFYDDAGNVGKVNARTGEVRATMKAVSAKPAAPAGVTHAVDPTDLYPLALDQIQNKARSMGVDPSRIRLLSAVHETRYFNGAWVGDEWRFFFGWGSEKGGLEYMVPARRTMVSETMMDAFEPESKGLVSAERLAEGIDATLFDMAVKTSPDSALKAANRPVGRVTLLPRIDKTSGDKDLWYSLQDMRGDEAAVVNARTGEAKVYPAAEKGDGLKAFGLWLLGAGLVALIYGALYWAATHAPAAPNPNPEYNGPMPSWEQMFGGMLGALGLGFAGSMMMVPDMLGYPTDNYADAFKAASEAAKARGVSADQVRFVQATSNIPVFQGKHWNYTFTYVKDGKTSLVYVDMERQLGGTGMEWRTAVYEGVDPKVVSSEPLRADLLPKGVRLNPELALGFVRKQEPKFGPSASVKLELRREAESNDGNLWYVFYDSYGGVAAVQAQSGEIRMEQPAVGPRHYTTAQWVKGVLIVTAVALLALAAAGTITWMGGAAGMMLAAGTLKSGKKGAPKPKITDDDVRAAVKSVTASKGGIWSQTEYNMGYSNVYESLKSRGATKRQLALYEKLCAEAPVIGGRFNPWSGD